MVRRLTDKVEDEEYGPDYEDAGFELVGPVDEAELAEGRAIVSAALRPSAKAVVARELTRLRFATASREFNTADMAMMSAIYAEELGRFPEDVVVKVCRDWAKRAKFWPTLCELTEPAERMMVERRNLAEALARGPRKPPEPDPYEERRRQEIEAQEERYREAARYRDAHPELMGSAEPPLGWVSAGITAAALGPLFVETVPAGRAEDAGAQSGENSSSSAER